MSIGSDLDSKITELSTQTQITKEVAESFGERIAELENTIDFLEKWMTGGAKPHPYGPAPGWYDIWTELTDARPGGANHEQWKTNYTNWILTIDTPDLRAFILDDITQLGLPLKNAAVSVPVIGALPAPTMGQHGFVLKGVPSKYGWSRESNVQVPAQPAGYPYILPWFVMAEIEGNTDYNTAIQLRNGRAWMKKNGFWIPLEGQDRVWAEAYPQGSDYWSVSVPQPLLNGNPATIFPFKGHNPHGGFSTWSDATGATAIRVTMQARAQGTGDYGLIVGADWYPSTSKPDHILPTAGGSRCVRIQKDWTDITFSTE